MRNRELANDSITHPMLDPGCAESTVVFIPCLLHTAFLIRFIVRAASNVIIETRRFGGSRGLYFQYICLKTFCGGGGGVFFCYLWCYAYASNGELYGPAAPR